MIVVGSFFQPLYRLQYCIMCIISLVKQSLHLKKQTMKTYAMKTVKTRRGNSQKLLRNDVKKRCCKIQTQMKCLLLYNKLVLLSGCTRPRMKQHPSRREPHGGAVGQCRKHFCQTYCKNLNVLHVCTFKTFQLSMVNCQVL